MLSKLAASIVIVSASLAGLGQTRPDLVVAALAIDANSSGQFVGIVSVTLSNVCRGSEAASSFVLVTFKESAQPGSKQIYFVGSRVRSLKGGDSQTVTFDALASGKQIGLDRHVIAEVDPYRKIAEGSEINNWRTLNPSTGGSPDCRAR